MSFDDTPASTPDPETGAEGDSDQLPIEDTLIERGVGDLLDEGYSPPDRPSDHRFGLTALEELLGEPLDQRLARELPEVWDAADGPVAGAREPDRAGRLEAGVSEATGDSATSLMADDVGIAGGAARAEDAAVHIIEDDQLEEDNQLFEDDRS
jgi:hypothetical protein